MTREEYERLANIGREALDVLKIKLRNEDSIAHWGSMIEQSSKTAARIKENSKYTENNRRIKKANSILNKLRELQKEIKSFDNEWPMSISGTSTDYEIELLKQNKLTRLSRKQLHEDTAINSGFDLAIWHFTLHVHNAELDADHKGGYSNFIGSRDAGGLWSEYAYFIGKPTITKNPDDHSYRGNFLEFVRYVLARGGVTPDDLGDAGIYQACISGHRKLYKNNIK